MNLGRIVVFTPWGGKGVAIKSVLAFGVGLVSGIKLAGLKKKPRKRRRR